MAVVEEDSTATTATVTNNSSSKQIVEMNHNANDDPDVEESRKVSNELFDEIDLDATEKLSISEMEAFVESNSKLWSVLSIHYGFTVQECQEQATLLAMKLATGRSGGKKEVSRSQFHRFRQQYIEDPEGLRDFFHRMIFQAFDKNRTGWLELDRLLDAVYKVNSHLENFQATKLQGGLLQGNLILPPKDVLKKQIYDECNVDEDGKISLEEFLRYNTIIRKRNVKQMRKEGMRKEERYEQEERALVRAEVHAKLKQSAEVVESSKEHHDGGIFDGCTFCDWVRDIFFK